MQSSSEMVIALAFHWVWEEEELLLLLFMLLFAQRVHYIAPATGFASKEVYCLNAIGSKYRVSHLLWVCLSNNRYVRQTIKDLEYFAAAFLLKKQGLTVPVCGRERALQKADIGLTKNCRIIFPLLMCLTSSCFTF